MRPKNEKEYRYRFYAGNDRWWLARDVVHVKSGKFYIEHLREDGRWVRMEEGGSCQIIPGVREVDDTPTD